jgi:HPt (histidine-containing phosphotransfer) domain-containing protein
MARLSQEAGVDIHKGLAVLNGKQDRLISLLRMMAITHRSDMQRIQICLLLGDHEQARRIAHTLGGVAAMMGAKDLFAAVGAVEARLRENPAIAAGDMTELIAAAKSQLERLLEIVGTAMDFKSTPTQAHE